MASEDITRYPRFSIEPNCIATVVYGIHVFACNLGITLGGTKSVLRIHLHRDGVISCQHCNVLVFSLEDREALGSGAVLFPRWTGFLREKYPWAFVFVTSKASDFLNSFLQMFLNFLFKRMMLYGAREIALVSGSKRQMKKAAPPQPVYWEVISALRSCFARLWGYAMT